MKVDTLSLGILTLIAEHAGPFLKVGIRSPSGVEHGELHMTVGEWTSLKAVTDVLAAADRRHAEDRAQIDVLRAEADDWKRQAEFARREAEHLKAQTRHLGGEP